MQFKNPCKNCIISPMCQLICNPRDDLLNTWDKLGSFIAPTCGILVCIVLVALAFTPPTIYLRIGSAVLGTVSIFSVFCQFIIKKIKRSNNLRFNRIITLRPSKPPPPPGPPPIRKII